ncbi:HNH endonuclease [Pedobacter hiemivivus]|uniref:HNH endonuclease n=1 Tax=Pedobacter hiemivivus TaxID=2530454 RepID=A0A4U1GDA4_9SPHI|nr:HNH endonuclease [Pedobacter hiemivivus]TKC59182.1 HNH endonuclease [Pedobacter hiemivivus]
MEEQVITVTTYPACKDKLDLFFQAYPNQSLYIPPDPPIRERIPRKDRVCRFCGKGAGEVKFKHEPHIIPRLLGHNYGISDFECDTCNHHFGTLENHFADYLGLIRTISSVGRNKIPKFISPLNSLIAAQTSKGGNKNFITIADESGDHFKFDTEREVWQIQYNKKPHTPINVYKCLLKIALSVMPEHEIKHYKPVLEFILENQHVTYFTPFAKVLQTTTEFYTEVPYCVIFKKRNIQDQVPMHMMYLVYENISYQLLIPFNQQDIHLDYSASINIPFSPPLLFFEGKEDQKFRHEILDLSSNQQLKNQKGFISFKAESSLFTDAYDTKAKQFIKKPITMDKITKIFLTKGDHSIDLEDLNI